MLKNLRWGKNWPGGEETDWLFFSPGKKLTSQFLPRGRNGPAWSFPGERLAGGKKWPLHRPAQPKKLGRGLKFRIQKLEVLYYSDSEQQRRWSDCADGRCAFVVCIWRKQVFSWHGSNRLKYKPSSESSLTAILTGLSQPVFLFFCTIFSKFTAILTPLSSSNSIWDFLASKASVTSLLRDGEYCVQVRLSPSYSHLYSCLLTRAFFAGLAVSPAAWAFDLPAEKMSSFQSCHEKTCLLRLQDLTGWQWILEGHFTGQSPVEKMNTYKSPCTCETVWRSSNGSI